MRSRACYRDKNCVVPPLRAKARVVCAGFTHPDLAQLERYSPTATRTSMFIVLQLAASGQKDPRGPWVLESRDAKNAFFQGNEFITDKLEPVFITPPKDPLITASGRFAAAELYEVVGNMYGKADAPAVWSNKVKSVMYDKGFVSHSLDVMFFL